MFLLNYAYKIFLGWKIRFEEEKTIILIVRSILQNLRQFRFFLPKRYHVIQKDKNLYKLHIVHQKTLRLFIHCFKFSASILIISCQNLCARLDVARVAFPIDPATVSAGRRKARTWGSKVRLDKNLLYYGNTASPHTHQKCDVLRA